MGIKRRDQELTDEEDHSFGSQTGFTNCSAQGKVT
jgi:hypothetical protein